MAGNPSSDEAVSPVIGVILLVAMTIVTAAVVFVLARGFSERTDIPSVIAVEMHDDQDELMIVRAAPRATAAQFEVSLGVAGGFGHNAAADDGDGTAIGANDYSVLGTETTTVAGGDVIRFCAVGGPATNVRVAVRRTESVSLVFDDEFMTLHQCPP